MTEHDQICEFSSRKLLIIPGIEVSTLGGHILGIGISSKIRKGLSADETIERIRDLGGLAIIPHPYDLACSSVRPRAVAVAPDAMETINSSALFFHVASLLARRDARMLALPKVGASDSHISQTVGDGYTLIDVDSRRIDDIIEAVRGGKTKPVGGPTSLLNKFRKLYRQATRV